MPSTTPDHYSITYRSNGHEQAVACFLTRMCSALEESPKRLLIRDWSTYQTWEMWGVQQLTGFTMENPVVQGELDKIVAVAAVLNLFGWGFSLEFKNFRAWS